MDLPGSMVLQPGVAIALLAPVRPAPKIKYCLFCSVDDPPLYVFINSGMHPIVQNNQRLLEQQVELPMAELDWRIKQNSYIDCSSAFSNFSRDELCKKIETDRGCYMGRVSDDVLRSAIGVISTSYTLRPIEKSAMLAGLRSVVSDQSP